MPSYLNRQRLKGSYHPATRYTYKKEIPPQYADEFFRRLNSLTSYNKELIAEIIPDNQTLSFPLGTDHIERYLTGFNITYTPFDNLHNPKIEGYFERDPNADNYNVYFNSRNASHQRQLNTCVHETMHICQSKDDYFQSYFDDLITNQTFPPNIIVKLFEMTTQKATAMYIMPSKHFYRKYTETQSVSELSDYFHASMQSVTIRLKELGLAMPPVPIPIYN
jgi:hypothetical protein